MPTIEFNNKSFRDLSRFNILLGKNGCGKSRALKDADAHLRNQPVIGAVRYISPERHGFLTYEPGIDLNIEQDANWLPSTRRTNQAQGFKQQSAALYRRLELDFLRRLQEDHIKEGYEPRHFNEVVDSINSLLERVEIRSAESSFAIHRREDGSRARAEEISSGESELIALSIEILSFKNLISNLENTSYLFLDEPDVHLHPDLQEKLVNFLTSTFADMDVVIVIATHSTSFVGAIAEAADARIGFMKAGDAEIIFESIDDVTKAILPMFGTHPLSNVFNRKPVLIVEGEDDHRIWSQAVRSSLGAIKVFPCVATSKDVINEYEQSAVRVINAVYDNAKGFSLRDRDDDPEEVADLGPIIRMRLSCRTAENLMLTNDALQVAEVDWTIMQERLRRFVDENSQHPYHQAVRDFVETGPDRKSANIKAIRNVVVGLITEKPWEVLVGQAIAAARHNQTAGEGSIRDFGGEKVWHQIVNAD